MYAFEGISRLWKLNTWQFFFPIRGKTAKLKLIISVTLADFIIPQPEHLHVGLIAGWSEFVTANPCFRLIL